MLGAILGHVMNLTTTITIERGRYRGLIDGKGPGENILTTMKCGSRIPHAGYGGMHFTDAGGGGSWSD